MFQHVKDDSDKSLVHQMSNNTFKQSMTPFSRWIFRALTFINILQIPWNWDTHCYDLWYAITFPIKNEYTHRINCVSWLTKLYLHVTNFSLNFLCAFLKLFYCCKCNENNTCFSDAQKHIFYILLKLNHEVTQLELILTHSTRNSFI